MKTTCKMDICPKVTQKDQIQSKPIPPPCFCKVCAYLPVITFTGLQIRQTVEKYHWEWVQWECKLVCNGVWNSIPSTTKDRQGNRTRPWHCLLLVKNCDYRADSRFATSQCNDVFRWLGANLEAAFSLSGEERSCWHWVWISRPVTSQLLLPFEWLYILNAI